MNRGLLRVFLGAAPGVGKTYNMLREGLRLQNDGKDVVAALVQTHGRATLEAMIERLEYVPRRSITKPEPSYKQTELNLPAVLARKPAYALVDELAHTNAPGLSNEKRWQDVEKMLEAGINVLSTVNIEHVESLTDVVEQITGVAQRDTIPDGVLRGADQIEIVDVAPQALRERLAEGVIYPAGKVDAALSNYFRLGNLTALRELTLLWLADEVDSALKRYRSENGINSQWAARERVVVALTGGPEGQTLLRRGARIAARSSGGELIAVHVASPEGSHNIHAGELAHQRTLVDKLGGNYHQVIGRDIPQALVDFARALNATQLVIGVSRRSRLAAMFAGPGIGATVIRESGEIDIHIVTHSAAGGRPALPQIGGALSLRRRLAGFLLAIAGGPLLTWILVSSRTAESITGDVLSYQLLVILVALTGGLWPAVFAAILSGITLNYFFVDPLHTFIIERPIELLALVLYVINALLVSFVVDHSARRSRTARRAAVESDLLASVAGSVLRSQDALQALVSRTREAFRLDNVRLVGDDLLAADGASGVTAEATVLPVGQNAVLELYGRDLQASERRLLAVIITQIEAAMAYRDLTETANEIGPLAEADRVRSALLAAVGHDLRRPLTAATAAITSLRAQDLVWSDDDRDELLETAEQSLQSLSDLVTNLLDASRLQAGVLGISVTAIRIDDAIMPALEELDLGPADVELDVLEEPIAVLADAVLLQRVLVNLLANAVRFSPADRPVLVATSSFGTHAQIRVVDFGPGITNERKNDVFIPFQRLGDTDNRTGLGLGLALSKGFAEGMGGTLEIEDTPGGGSTMVITLPLATNNATNGSYTKGADAS